MQSYEYILRIKGEIIDTLAEGVKIWDEQNKCYARIEDCHIEFPKEGFILIKIEYIEKERGGDTRRISGVDGETIYLRTIDKDKTKNKILRSLTEWTKNSGFISHELLDKSPFEDGDLISLSIKGTE